MKTRASVSRLPPTASAMWTWATRSPCQRLSPMAAHCPPGSASIREPRPSPARRSMMMWARLPSGSPQPTRQEPLQHRTSPVTVNNTNDAPVASVSIANQSTDEDAGFSFTVPPASFTDVDVGDTPHPFGHACRRQPACRPGSASIREPTASPVRRSTMMWAPLDPRHRHRHRRRDRNPGLSPSRSTIPMTPPSPRSRSPISPPMRTRSSASPLPPTSFTDVDVGDTLTLSATLADGSPLPAWLSFDPGTNSFSGTPLNDDVGALTIRVTATDTSGATATQDFTRHRQQYQ